VYSAEKNYLKKYDIRLVVISRGRSSSIANKTLSILPEWVDVVIPEEEKEEYEKVCNNPLVTYDGNEINGLGMTRNFVLDTFEENTVIMLDDDLNRIYSYTGELTRHISDIGEILQTFINTAVMSLDLGVSMFGYNMKDIRMYNGTEPFILNGWVGGIIGINGRKFRFRNDAFKVDVDFALQCLLVDRIVWVDNRFGFSVGIENNKGGSSIYRNEKRIEESVVGMRKKWGSAIVIKKDGHNNNMKTKINVPRKQAIVYD